MKLHLCTRLSGLFLLAALCSCSLRSYTPAPLDLPKAAESDAARRLDDADVLAALSAKGHDTTAWPDIVWNREQLATAMLSMHPEQRAARAKVLAALTRIQAGLKPAAPELTASMEHHSQTGDGKNSPWGVGAGLQWELVPGSVKSALNQAAGIESQEVRLTAGDTAWRLYRVLGMALLNRQLAMGRAQLAATGLELAMARDKSVSVRERYGVASAMEVQLTAQRLQDARRESAEADAAKMAAQAQLATALSVPYESLNRIRIAEWPLQTIPDTNAARQLALTNQLDFARQRLQYDAAEAELKLQIAKQFPSLKLGPGLLWSQGDSVWQFSFALPAALLNRNLAGIETAEAHRRAQGAAVLAKQSEIINEIERLRLNALALTQPLNIAQASLKAAESQVKLTTAQFEVGNVDALSVIDARSLQLQAERAVFDARTAFMRAAWELELAMQAPVSAVDKP
jgi:outer membrane protein, heavy metal efflux system